MEKLLENLWFNYIIELPIQKTKKEKQIVSEWLKQEKYFRSKLNEEQIEFLEEYDNALSEVNRITEKNAFIKGVMFATRFIFEAMCDE